MDKVVLIHRMKRGYEMNDTDKKVNKKSNLKIYIIFAIMILVSLLGGFLAGRLAAVNKDTLDGINWDNIWRIVADTLPIAYGVLMLMVFVVSFVMYGKIKRAISGWDGEDEDVIAERGGTYFLRSEIFHSGKRYVFSAASLSGLLHGVP